MNNLLSYCGLTDSRMRASEKDLPVMSNRSRRWAEYFYPSEKMPNESRCSFNCTFLGAPTFLLHILSQKKIYTIDN